MEKIINPKYKLYYEHAEKLLASSKSIEDIFNLSFDVNPLNKNKNAFVYFENGKRKTIKYKDFKNETIKIAGKLNPFLKDITKHNFIALRISNNGYWPLLYYAILYLGYKVLLINNLIEYNAVNDLLAQSDTKAIITDDNKTYNVTTLSLDKILSSNTSTCIKDFENEVAFVTSGTTGDSKIYVFDGEKLSHQIVSAYNMPIENENIMYKNKLNILISVPFAHIFGFVATFLWFTFFGSTIVIPSTIESSYLINVIKKEKISHIFTVPLFFELIQKRFNRTYELLSAKKKDLIDRFIKYNNNEITSYEAGFARKKIARSIIQNKILGTHIKFLITGGASISKDTMKLINGLGYELHNGFGMTEIGITSVDLSKDVKTRNSGSIGKPLFDVTYKIENNELLINSLYIHKYRIINKQCVAPLIDENGFFHSEDIASVDENGNYYLLGKMKDVIIASNGENIYPEQEEKLFDNLTHVNDLIIVANKNEEICLLLNVDYPLMDNEKDVIANQISKINDTLKDAFKVKHTYIVKEKLIRNASLKLKRNEIRQLFLSDSYHLQELDKKIEFKFDNVSTNELTKVREIIFDIFSDVLYVDKKDIALESHIIKDLNGDSFSYMSIVFEIEKKFNIKIESEMLSKLNTVGDFVNYVLSKNQLSKNSKKL